MVLPTTKQGLMRIIFGLQGLLAFFFLISTFKVANLCYTDPCAAEGVYSLLKTSHGLGFSAVITGFLAAGHVVYGYLSVRGTALAMPAARFGALLAATVLILTAVLQTAVTYGSEAIKVSTLTTELVNSETEHVNTSAAGHCHEVTALGALLFIYMLGEVAALVAWRHELSDTYGEVEVMLHEHTEVKTSSDDVGQSYQGGDASL